MTLPYHILIIISIVASLGLVALTLVFWRVGKEK